MIATPASAALQAGDWAFVLDSWGYLSGGVLLTIALTIASILLGFLAGFPFGIIEVYGNRYLQTPVHLFGTVFRGTPLVVILIFAFFVFPIQRAFVAAILGLGLRSAAYQSQIFRGALSSIDEGQMEAARSIGMNQFQAIRHVVVPQALRRSMPGFQNEFTIVLKDTSLAYAIGMAELLTRTHDLFVQQTTAVLELFLFASAIYFVLTFSTNRALDALQNYFAIPDGDIR
ncbi:MAG: amino acid ABC transporter permease [Halobacteriota archaeon]|uniref:Glutamine ABC transporter substrate-binding protein n=1 Tax=Halodesulfurarchaeum formicicum TaxID=1873524 RepID=A0A1D8S4A9_9EURY|nr:MULTISPECIES: amino acid ABC transporter permease [Halodesulfurarchaeum]AOW80191.1 glutamine ABC transporter substrate-binding protein [Halodesulfurarchaeum formicicum]MDR5657216.1 amino acid ABC transporter permease [Halodesulfurarchaeum sp. HSR-GB]